MTRPRSTTLCLTVLVMLIGTPVISQPRDDPKNVETTDTQTIPFVSRGEVDFKGPYGELRVEGWDRPEVLITITKTLETNGTPADRAKKQERLNQVKVVAARKSPGILIISSTAPSPLHSRIQLTYDIKVPRESDLRINFHAGKISSKNVLGDISITARFGEISVVLPEGEYAIDAKARIGDVSSEFPVNARRPHLVDATARSTGIVETPSVFLRVVFGHIMITKVPSKT